MHPLDGSHEEISERVEMDVLVRSLCPLSGAWMPISVQFSKATRTRLVEQRKLHPFWVYVVVCKNTELFLARVVFYIGRTV